MKVRLVAAVVLMAVFAACGGGTPPPVAPSVPAVASASTADATAPAPPELTPAASDQAGPLAPTSKPTSAPTAPPSLMVAEAQPSPAFAPGPATKHDGCKARGALPDPACTPGAVMTKDLDVVCHRGTRERRHVEASVHKLAFSEYGYAFPQPRGAFEVDHLVPLELGGDNTIENLWAEPAKPKPGFHEKDKVENYLHKQVCSGAMTLDEAQKEIATDWVNVWMRAQAAATSVGL